MSERGLYCVRTRTLSMSEFAQLDRLKSISRNLPPNGTAGLERMADRTESRSPAPPASTTARTVRIACIAPVSRRVPAPAVARRRHDTQRRRARTAPRLVGRRPGDAGRTGRYAGGAPSVRASDDPGSGASATGARLWLRDAMYREGLGARRPRRAWSGASSMARERAGTRRLRRADRPGETARRDVGTRPARRS